VELRRHRAHHQAAGARAAPHRAAAREIDDYYANFRVTRDLLELRNLVDCAELIVRSALRATKAAACTSAATSRPRCR
jgi:succinate dehydrogenase/fumarate reductase flavoprotein subunit